MPSKKILTEKQAYVETLKAKLDASVAGVIVDYKGISVEQDTKLRRALREANVEYFVVKNTMLRFALKDKGYTNIEKTLEGTTAIAVSNDDPIVAAKILSKFADDNKDVITLKSGYMNGVDMAAAEIVAIAKLPGKQELLSMLCSALQGNIRGLAVALNAVAEKSEEVA